MTNIFQMALNHQVVDGWGMENKFTKWIPSNKIQPAGQIIVV